MIESIEFFEIPEECKIELHFKEGIPRTYRCRVDISHGNVVSEVFDQYDNIIASCMQDLRDMDVVSAYLLSKHDIENL